MCAYVVSVCMGETEREREYVREEDRIVWPKKTRLGIGISSYENQRLGMAFVCFLWHILIQKDCGAFIGEKQTVME